MEGFIYLIRLREFVNDNRNVYKLGMTTREFIKRMQQYSAKSVDEVYIKYYVDDCKYVESELKKIFNNTFIVMRDYGKEYYCGDVWEMVNTIHNYIMDNNHYIDDSNNFKHVKINKNIEDRTCPNCFKVFKYKYLLDKHFSNTRVCKKVELDENGDPIQNKKFECENCGDTFMYESTLKRHQRETCNKNKNYIKNKSIDNTINNNSTNNIVNTLHDNIICDKIGNVDKSTNITYNMNFNINTDKK